MSTARFAPTPAGPVGEAHRTWLACCAEAGWAPRRPVERVPLDAAAGRTTAADVHALWSSPAQERAAMDGVAVRSADTVDASQDRPVRLPPGSWDVVDTGDPLPAGRDAVIMREHVRRVPDGTVEIVAPAPPGRHVRPIGEDVVAGERLLPAGHRVRPVDAAMVAAAGHRDLPVVRRPVVAVLPTGDEIRPVGSALEPGGLGPGGIVDTNSLMLAGMAQEAGCATRVLPVVPDDPALLATAVGAAADGADLVLVIAGSSAGRDDHTAGVLATLGKVAVHGVAMRPGHPVVLGVLEDTVPVPVVGVPGYPVSAAHVFDTFAAPMIAALTGGAPRPVDRVTAVLGTAVDSPGHVEESVLVRLEDRDGTLTAVPSGRGAGALSRLARADGVLRVPAGATGHPAGATVTVERLPGAPAADRVGTG
ncbi:molybdopterin-binding protein [Pseudonocardia sp.]|uniref:molybdopterin-binding protein n=1 Tax=Pseudonocardia sp. TaxID=60912 RepID=UPI002607B81B|nr:molybdopterin-binding protein [Pseudonocardia sp.]